MMWFGRKELTKAVTTQTQTTGVTWDSRGHHSVTTVPLQMSPLVWVQGGWRPVQGAVIRAARQWTLESFVFTLAKKNLASHEKKVGRKRKGNYIPRRGVRTTLHDMSTVATELRPILLLLHSTALARIDFKTILCTWTCSEMRDKKKHNKKKREDKAVEGSRVHCSVLF